jgi:REP element-mobilizing transposase RayT
MRDLAFFISWTCYGQWLHGDRRGSVDVEHNVYGQPWLPADSERWRGAREQMNQPPYALDAARRRLVLQAIREVCAHRRWILHAVHVRWSHIHVVVSGDQAPERMMNDFKAYASRALNAASLDGPPRKRWTRHGSTRHIDAEAHLAAAVHYVLHEQGEPMERWPETEAAHPATIIRALAYPVVGPTTTGNGDASPHRAVTTSPRRRGTAPARRPVAAPRR